MYDDDYPVFLGFGSMHELRDADSDPRNPRLVGLKSVSYAAAVAMNRTRPENRQRRVGFRIPRK